MELPSLDLDKVYENKSSRLKREDVKILQDWLVSKHSTTTDVEEIELISNLVECDYDIEATKKRISGALAYRSRAKIFQDIDFKSNSLQAAMETILVSTLKLIDESKTAIFIRVLANDPKLVNASNICKVILAYSSLFFRVLQPPVDHVLIFDLELVTLAHIPSLDMRTLRELSIFYNYFYLGTLEKIHIINAGPWINRLIALFTATIGREFSEKICVHTEANNLHEFIAMDHLPKEMGGNFLSFHQLHGAMKDLLLKHSDEFLHKYKKPSNEFLHIDSSNWDCELFGVDGTFRQLEVD
ncbi:hypothetical protein DMENIID0001_031670 [Sergentomyia squamirostris]